MSNGKQPLEGLTVRIWDPPSKTESEKTADENLLKGNRGFRQYTEQVGSDKLKYTTHDWDTDTKKAHSTELKQSTRDWDAEKKKKESVQELPLLSRSDPRTDTQSLRDVKLQYELWDHIMKQVKEIKDLDNAKEWEPTVNLLRKLREGVYASNWSRGDYAFAIKVFEHSVNFSIKAHNYEELAKSLFGLINELYVINKGAENPYYVVLNILYYCCYLQNPTKALTLAVNLNGTTNEGRFGKQLVKSVFISGNSLMYFRLYHNNPYSTFKILMDNYNDAMRIKAIDILRKAYLSASIGWIGKWLGITNNSNMVISEIERLVKPTCIKSIDHDRQLIYFLKKRK
ncbi:hypothetical protein INT47_002667 [Mucor saturninus]|uniref:Uncharacterized protein n=1 Tax=Mucor saturninus TaxID=64648 RepID=A0A8H7UWP4_9FUNG|nr:hypothetical protein INT47_002667 [Mucor saturninus]